MLASNFSPTDKVNDEGNGDSGTLIFTGLGRSAVPGPHLLPARTAASSNFLLCPTPVLFCGGASSFIHKQKQLQDAPRGPRLGRQHQES